MIAGFQIDRSGERQSLKAIAAGRAFELENAVALGARASIVETDVSQNCRTVLGEAADRRLARRLIRRLGGCGAAAGPGSERATRGGGASGPAGGGWRRLFGGWARLFARIQLDGAVANLDRRCFDPRSGPGISEQPLEVPGSVLARCAAVGWAGRR